MDDLHHAVAAEVGRRGVDCRNNDVLHAVVRGRGETGGAPAATGGKGRVRGHCDLMPHGIVVAFEAAPRDRVMLAMERLVWVRVGVRVRLRLESNRAGARVRVDSRARARVRVDSRARARVRARFNVPKGTQCILSESHLIMSHPFVPEVRLYTGRPQV